MQNNLLTRIPQLRVGKGLPRARNGLSNSKNYKLDYSHFQLQLTICLLIGAEVELGCDTHLILDSL